MNIIEVAHADIGEPTDCVSVASNLASTVSNRSCRILIFNKCAIE